MSRERRDLPAVHEERDLPDLLEILHKRIHHGEDGQLLLPGRSPDLRLLAGSVVNNQPISMS